jgi:peptidoglycan/LPS O-acetylase OafA/YrhL
VHLAGVLERVDRQSRDYWRRRGATRRVAAALNWHWIFFINLPIGAVAIALGAVLVPENKGLGVRQGIDVLGSVLITAGLMLVIYAVVKSRGNGWGTEQTLIPLGGGLALIAAFLALEARVTSTALPWPVSIPARCTGG